MSGFKQSRFAGIAAVDANNRITEIYQVGRQTLGGIPVVRERRAILDILKGTPLDSTYRLAENVGLFFRPYV